MSSQPGNKNQEDFLDLSSLGEAELAAMEQLINSSKIDGEKNQANIHLIENLKEALTRAQGYDEEQDPIEKFLGTALSGGEVSCEDGAELFGCGAGSPTKEYRVLTIKFTEGKMALAGMQKLVSQIQAAVEPGKALVVNMTITVVWQSATSEMPDKLVERIRSTVLLANAKCAIGVSDPTTHFDLLSVCFDHALFAANTAVEERVPVKLYRDCMFEYFIARSEAVENFAYLRDMRVLSLYESDRDGGSDLLNTAIIYIERGFNLGHTAAEMHLHRNSVVYRLNRVAEKSGIDLLGPCENFDVLTLLMTCKMYRSKLDRDAVPEEWMPNC